MPSTISVLVTPRVSFCAIAVPVSATVTTSTSATPDRFFIAHPLSRLGEDVRPPPKSRVLPLRIHAVDHVLVLCIHERSLQLHRRRQLLVLGGEDLLDEPELLDRLDAGKLLVHPFDLAPDQVLDL